MHYKTRMPLFVEQARAVQHDLVKAKALSEAELDWIYDNHQGDMPHKAINAYRKALREADLWEPYVRRTVTHHDPQEKVDRHGYWRGYMSERIDHVHARMAREKTNIEQRLSSNNEDDALLLDGHEHAYLLLAQRLCAMPEWPDAAVGLGMALGCRPIEICQRAQLTLTDQPYEVLLSGLAHTGTAARETAVIPKPVLLPASTLCATLYRVQQGVEAENVQDYQDFDDRIARKLRHTVKRWLEPLLGTTTPLSPRSFRNCYIALCLEATTPDGVPLHPPGEDVDHFIGRIIGHQPEVHRARDHYKKHILPRLRRNIVLPN